MKKIIPTILMLLVIVQLFAPFGVGVNNKRIENNINIANAETELEDRNISYTLTATDTELIYLVKVEFDPTKFSGGVNSYIFKMTMVNSDGSDGKTSVIKNMKKISDGVWQGDTSFSGLYPDTSYKFVIGVSKQTGTSTITYLFDKIVEGKTNQSGNKTQTLIEQDTKSIEKVVSSPSDLPPCGIDGGAKIMGCVAQGLYYLLFKPTAWIFAGAGKLLDVSLMYSISDNSYRSNFVTNGWGIVRDFCNMFFIFILLYVAFGTILDLNGVKTKETIVHVIIIGILINFSLFATKIIIDASNILARVFYNQNTISITTEGSGNSKETGDFGEIKLSELIISKANPTTLISKASEVGQIPIKGSGINENNTDTSDTTENTTTYTPKTIDVGNFIIVIVLSVIINIIGIGVFVSCAFIFITRVVGLWIAMILVPMAFFTYAVPQLQNLEMIGWKKWWSETLSLSFVAPIFAFFMYIIVAFMDKGLDTVISTIQSSKPGLSMVISIIIPYIFIMVLMLQAKSIAKKMSGKMGEIATNAASSIINAGKSVALGAGGLVAGGAIGLGAKVARGTIGKIGSNIANSEKWKDASAEGGVKGLFARSMVHAGNKASTSSMDIRGLGLGSKIKVGGKSLDSLGFKTGKAKEGGLVGDRKRKVEKRQNRMKELEVGEDSKEMQDIREAEVKLNEVKTDKVRQNKLLDLNNGRGGEEYDKEKQETENKIIEAETNYGVNSQQAQDARNELEQLLTVGKGIGSLERDLASAEKSLADRERDLKDAVNALNAINSNPKSSNADRIKAQKEVDTAKGYRDVEINGGVRADGSSTKGRNVARSNLEVRQQEIRDAEKDIHIAENNLKKALNTKIGIENKRRQGYADAIRGDLYAFTNFITTLSTQENAEREAANKILAGIKEEQKIKAPGK